MVRFVVVASLGLLAACGDHEYDLRRVGGSDVTFDAQPRVFPCEVRSSMAVCPRCHTPEPEGAHVGPFPLLQWEDTQKAYAGKPIYVHMKNVIESNLMPYTLPPPLDPPVEPLTPTQKAAMLDWLGANAPAGDPSVACE